VFLDGRSPAPLERQLLLRLPRSHVLQAETDLRAWIRAHHVTWERQPRPELDTTHRLEARYDIALYAWQSVETYSPPGSPHCRELHDALRDLVTAAVAQSGNGAVESVEVSPFLPLVVMRPESGWVSEVEIDVELRSPHRPPSAPAPADRFRALEIALARLGVQPGSWRWDR
jgi:hypothetical protein